MNITQKISNFVGGISQQPDELMPPGSVRDAVNVIPDVTSGLTKRPAGRLVQPLLTSKDGKWFNIYRDNVEQYIGKVNRDGTVEMFNAQYGLGNLVLYDDKPFSLYPELPGEPEGETTNPVCSIELYTLALQEYQTAVAAVLAKRSEVEILLSQKDQQTTSNFRYWDAELLSNNVWWIKEGLALRKGNDDIEKNWKIVGVPELNDNEELKKGKKRLDNRLITVESPDFDVWQRGDESLDGITWFRGDAWEVEVTRSEESSNPNIEEDLEQAQNELRQLEQEMDEAYAIYVEQAANCDITAEPLAQRDGSLDPNDIVNSPYLVHEEDDDIQTVFHNLELTEELIAQIEDN